MRIPLLHPIAGAKKGEGVGRKGKERDVQGREGKIREEREVKMGRRGKGERQS